MLKGSRHSEETKARMSDVLKGNKRALGFKHSEETRKKDSEALRGNKRALGFKHSGKTRRKISESGKDRKPSGETRRKMSEAQLGNKHGLGYRHSAEARQKISASNIGKTLSGETRRRMSISQTNRPPIADATRQKMSLARKGDKCHKWKGGITPLNKILRLSLEYAQWRRSVLKRDSHACCGPGPHSGKLHAHHIVTIGNGPGLIYSIGNGITLCKKCHELTYGREDLFVERFTNHLGRLALDG